MDGSDSIPRLHPADYRVEWDRILPGVKAALKHQHEGLRPEDVYCDLKAKTAYLYTWSEGFIVFKIFLTDAGSRELLVWLAHSESHTSAIIELSDEVDQLARDVNCQAIQTCSDRLGFSRVLPKLGWEMMHVRWRRAL